MEERVIGKRVEGMRKININLLSATHEPIDFPACAEILAPSGSGRRFAPAEKGHFPFGSGEMELIGRRVEDVQVAFHHVYQFPYRQEMERGEADDDRAHREDIRSSHDANRQEL